jgi:hypothetical protein
MDWRRLRKQVEDLFDLTERPDEPVYEPLHVGTVLVCSLAAIAALYWLLWALLVRGGGLFRKVGPVLDVVFTSRTLADYGYAGFPHTMGVFDGWIANVVALAVTVLLVVALWTLFEGGRRSGSQR